MRMIWCVVSVLVCCSTAFSAQAPWAGARWTDEVYVVDYGAKCDNLTDDAAAIQAAINVASVRGTTVRLPPRACLFGTTLTVGAPTGTTATNISLRGSNPVTSLLKWTGSTSGVAVKLVNNRYFRIQDLAIINTVATGTTVGLLQAGYGGAGTETFAGIIDHVTVQGFHHGIQAGDDVIGVSSSDILYTFLELSNNDIGWIDYQLNTLNHVFTDLNLLANGIGLHARLGNVYVRGGSTSGNTTADFYIGLADQVVIRDMRAEVTAGRFVVVGYMNGEGETAPTVVVIDGNMTTSVPADGIVIDVLSGVHIQLSNNVLSGGVSTVANGFPGVLTMIGNKLTSPSAFVPLTLSTPTNDNAGSGRVDFRSNFRANGHTVFPDIAGLFTKGTTSTASRIDPDRRRVQVTFVSSGTATVTFARTVTATNTMFGFDLSAGAVRLSDLNEPVTYTPSGGTLQSGLITAVNVADNEWTVNGFQGPLGCGTCTALTVTVGRTEPNANYFPVASCNAQETFSWSSLSTTGFTLTSSNSSSTATCNVWIVR